MGSSEPLDAGSQDDRLHARLSVGVDLYKPLAHLIGSSDKQQQQQQWRQQQWQLLVASPKTCPMQTQNPHHQKYGHMYPFLQL